MKSDESTAEIADLGAEILSYLVQHPHARDTCEGIVEWWFLEQGIQRAEREVRRALRALVGNGMLLASRPGGSPIQYRLNRDRLPQIRAQLASRRRLPGGAKTPVHDRQGELMSTKMCRVSNHERRPVVLRGLSGQSYHLGSLETGREIRALELEGNPMVDKLKQRNVLSVEEVATQSKRSRKRARTAAKRATPAKSAGRKKADKSGS